MKKFFAILAVAGVMVACNDSASTENKAAGADSSKVEGVAADAQKAADSASKAMTGAADTANKAMTGAADTANKMINKAEKAVEGAKEAGKKMEGAAKEAVKDVKEAVKQ